MEREREEWELNKCDKLMSKNINEIIIYDYSLMQAGSPAIAAIV